MEAFLVGILCHLKSGLRNLVSQGWEVKVSSFVRWELTNHGSSLLDLLTY